MRGGDSMKIYPRAVAGGIVGGIVACTMISAGPVGHGVLTVAVLGLCVYTGYAMLHPINQDTTVNISKPSIPQIAVTSFRPKLNIRYAA